MQIVEMYRNQDQIKNQQSVAATYEDDDMEY